MGRVGPLLYVAPMLADLAPSREQVLTAEEDHGWALAVPGRAGLRTGCAVVTRSINKRPVGEGGGGDIHGVQWSQCNWLTGSSSRIAVLHLPSAAAL